MSEIFEFLPPPKRDWDVRTVDPLVSVCVQTFQHKDFIRDCLDGILMQETSFPFEVLLHDDASDDGTSEICREYADKYPNIIRPFLLKENQFSKGVRPLVELQIPRARGRYVALCEGDDYWIDSQKLQTQVDLLERNPECSACAHRNHRLQGKCNLIASSSSELESRVTLKDLAWSYFFQTASLMFIKSKLNIPGEYKGVIRDVFLWMLLAEKGDIIVTGQVMSVYRIHEGGISSRLTSNEKIKSREFHQNKRIEYFQKQGNILVSLLLKRRLAYDLFEFAFSQLTKGRGILFLSALKKSFRYSKGVAQTRNTFDTCKVVARKVVGRGFIHRKRGADSSSVESKGLENY